MTNILIIVQARMSSTRFPGKVLKKVLDKPLLWYVIRRLEQVKALVRVVIASGSLEANQPIIDFSKEFKFDYFIGDEKDVLDRYYQAAKHYNGEIIIRITSDCPLIDPKIIDQMLKIYQSASYDYYSNVHPPSFPDGLDTEIFSFKSLGTAWKKAKLPSEREHVTPYIWKNENKEFVIGNYENTKDLSNIRLTVDTPEDFELLKLLIEHFHNNWDNFYMDDVIKYLNKNPELLMINEQFERDEGYAKSLEEDKQFLKED